MPFGVSRLHVMGGPELRNNSRCVSFVIEPAKVPEFPVDLSVSDPVTSGFVPANPAVARRSQVIDHGSVSGVHPTVHDPQIRLSVVETVTRSMVYDPLIEVPKPEQESMQKNQPSIAASLEGFVADNIPVAHVPFSRRHNLMVGEVIQACQFGPIRPSNDQLSGALVKLFKPVLPACVEPIGISMTQPAIIVLPTPPTRQKRPPAALNAACFLTGFSERTTRIPGVCPPLVVHRAPTTREVRSTATVDQARRLAHVRLLSSRAKPRAGSSRRRGTFGYDLTYRPDGGKDTPR